MITNVNLGRVGDRNNNPLAQKLGNYLSLTAAEIATLDGLVLRKTRRYEARHEIVREGDPACTMRFMLSGWANRYKQLPDGRRQTVGFFLPGDICDLNVAILKVMDHSLAAISAVVITEIGDVEFESTISQFSRLKKAFQWESLVNMAIQREWTHNLGQRSAFERIAHLLCEIHLRLELVGMSNGNLLEFPLTQTDLAEAGGISTVHVNRTMQELRRAGLIHQKGRQLELTNLEGLREAASFDPRYLHLGRQGEEL